MILAAGLLLLVGLGLLVAGVVTGVTTLYWACVAVCAVAAVLLVLVRRRLAAEAPREAAERPRRTRSAARGATTPEAAPEASGRPEIPRPAGEPVIPEPVVPEAVVPEAVVPEAQAADVDSGPPTGAHAAGAGTTGPDEAPLEEVEVTDLLLVVDLHDEVLVIDEHPRYHLPGCGYLSGRTAIPLPIDEARSDGFTPCGSCRPDRTLAQQVRARRAGNG